MNNASDFSPAGEELRSLTASEIDAIAGSDNSNTGVVYHSNDHVTHVNIKIGGDTPLHLNIVIHK
jgi:hypothetical protein